MIKLVIQLVFLINDTPRLVCSFSLYNLTSILLGILVSMNVYELINRISKTCIMDYRKSGRSTKKTKLLTSLKIEFR